MQLFHSVLYRRGQHLHFYITIQNLLPVQGKLLLLHCLCKVFQTKVSITMTIGVIIRFKIIYIDKQEYPRLFLSKLMFNICPESSAIQGSCQCIRTGQTNISFFIFFYNILLFSYISLSA